MVALAAVLISAVIVFRRPGQATRQAYHEAYAKVVKTLDEQLPRIRSAPRGSPVVASEITVLAAAFDTFDSDLRKLDFGSESDAAAAAESASEHVASDLRQLAQRPGATNGHTLNDDLQVWDQTTLALAADLGVALPTPPVATPTP